MIYIAQYDVVKRPLVKLISSKVGNQQLPAQWARLFAEKQYNITRYTCSFNLVFINIDRDGCVWQLVLNEHDDDGDDDDDDVTKFMMSVDTQNDQQQRQLVGWMKER